MYVGSPQSYRIKSKPFCTVPAIGSEWPTIWAPTALPNKTCGDWAKFYALASVAQEAPHFSR